MRIVSRMEFTNVKCTSFDKEFTDFEYCYLNSVNRSYKYLSLKCNLLQAPVTKIKLNVSFFKRFSGYRPFMYNVTVDFCRFLKNPNSNAFVNFWYRMVVDYSNINHTCPYNRHIRVEKLPIDVVNFQMTEVLPFPEGDYLIESTWIAYDIKRVE